MMVLVAGSCGGAGTAAAITRVTVRHAQRGDGVAEQVVGRPVEHLRLALLRGDRHVHAERRRLLREKPLGLGLVVVVVGGCGCFDENGPWWRLDDNIRTCWARACGLGGARRERLGALQVALLRWRRRLRLLRLLRLRWRRRLLRRRHGRFGRQRRAEEV